MCFKNCWSSGKQCRIRSDSGFGSWSDSFLYVHIHKTRQIRWISCETIYIATNYSNHWFVKEKKLSNISFFLIVQMAEKSANIDRVDSLQVFIKFHLFKFSEILILLLRSINYLKSMKKCKNYFLIKQDNLWKQRTHYRLENGSLSFIATLHKQ